MIEQINVKFLRVRDAEGQPTCKTRAFNCHFFGCRKFGQIEVCTYTNEDIERRPNDGTLIPVDGCPLWKS